MNKKIPKTPQPAAPSPRQRLKAERVELMLAQLSLWKAAPNRTAIRSSYELGSPHQAAAFVAGIAGLIAKRRGFLTVRDGRVSVQLQGEKAAGLTPAIGNLARRIERLAGQMQKIQEGR